MKIEHLIVQHLYNNKRVSLEDIGTFFLSPNVTLNTEEKDAVLPENAITFEYNPKTQRDDSLVDFIVQHSRKIKPLATSDLESYSILGREYLNIGKPFIIEGLGTLYKTQFGTYEFTQGSTINPKLEAQAANIKEKEDSAIDFSSPSRKKNSGKTGLLVLVLIILALSATAVIYFVTREKKVPVTTASDVNPDTIQPVQQIQTVTDSLPKKDSVSNNINSDSSTFKIIIKRYLSKDAAQIALDKFSTYGHKLQLIPQDSAYLIVMPFTAPLSDTAKAKDSLSRFFGVRTSVLQ